MIPEPVVDVFQVRMLKHPVLYERHFLVQLLELVIDDSLVRVKSTAEGWFAERHEIPSVRETRVLRGTITSSLYESGIEAGLTALQIMDLAKIFEYDVDFFSDFQPNDTFAVVFEETRYADGRST